MHEFKEMIEAKLDDMGRYYKNKEVKDITTTALDSMCKMVDMVKDISTIESMAEYFEDDREMSGARGRDRRTERYVSREMRTSMDESPRMARSRRSYNDNYGSYENRTDEFMDRLDEVVRTTSDPNKREAARMLIKELEGTN